MDKSTKCDIVSVGKRRDGGTRYWCSVHRADATAKYGKRAKKCRYSHIQPPKTNEILDLDINNYKGGIGIWGAVPPIYDTTKQEIDSGIHVHAREETGQEKEIDSTYRHVNITGFPKTLFSDQLVISELDAIYFMVSSIFGFEMKYIECTYCGYPHLDKDWFSVHPHKRHLCAGCGKHFTDTEVAIGNPIMGIRKALNIAISKPTCIFQRSLPPKPREACHLNQSKAATYRSVATQGVFYFYSLSVLIVNLIFVFAWILLSN